MAVKGSLESLGLEDLLQADLANQGGGRLTLRCGPLQAALYIDKEGVYVLEPDLLNGDRIVSALLQRGILSEDAYAEARQRDLTGTRLLDALVREGVVPEAEFLEMCASAAEDTILDLMLWEEGQFRFEEESREMSWCGLQGRLCVDPRGILERALARIDERVELANELGEHTILFEPLVGELPQLEGPDDHRHDVYMRLDGTSIVHEIALQAGIGRFEVLRTLRRLIEAGLARVANVEEVIVQVNERAQQRQHDVARALCLQWAESEPMEPGPLKKLASVSEAANNRGAALDALCALGHMHVKLGDAQEAVTVFKRAMRKAPADEVVLAGLQVAAEATGDDAVYADSTLLAAQAALDEDEVDKALDLLSPLVASDPGNVAAHLLRARALVMTENTEELLEHAEVVGQHLSRGGMKTKQERDAAAFFREALAEVAPDRGDLLERFRTLHVGSHGKRKRIALVSALVVLLGAAGFVFWPVSASSLLTKARAAADAGQTEEARGYIVQLLDKYPDSQEAEEGFQLQARLLAPSSSQPRMSEETLALKKKIDALVPQVQEALAKLPAKEARALVTTLTLALEDPKARNLRKAALSRPAQALRETARALHKDARDRIDLLGQTAGAQENLRASPEALKKFVDEATSRRDPGYAADLKETARVLARLGKVHGDAAFASLTKELMRVTADLKMAGESFDTHIEGCRRVLATALVDAADKRCREEAPALLVDGRLAEADALYAELQTLMETYGDDEIYADLVKKVERRKLPQFVRERRGQIAEINSHLAAGREAEKAENLEKAVSIYTALMKKHWLIRFEKVLQMPLLVESVPPGADVLVDGAVVGQSPLIVRYGLSANTLVEVNAPGFAGKRYELRAHLTEHPGTTVIRLDPEAIWTAPVGTSQATAPVDLAGDIVLSDRRGNVTRLAMADGKPLWRVDHSSLEGVRASPAVAGDYIYLACVDGRLRVINAADGSSAQDLSIGRPQGALAVIDDVVAVANAERLLVTVRGTAIVRRTPLGAVATTGAIAAHGSFWVGTADGRVVRVDRSGGVHPTPVASRNTAIQALAASPSGLLTTTADRSFASLTPAGAVRWKREGAGDPTGAPAEAAGAAGFADRRRGVILFDAETGEPREIAPLEGAARHGLVAAGGILIAARDDGRVWAYDPALMAVVLDAPVDDKSRFPVGVLGTDRLGIGAAGKALRVIPLPAAPR